MQSSTDSHNSSPDNESFQKMQLEWAMKGNDLLKEELENIIEKLETYLPRMKLKHEMRLKKEAEQLEVLKIKQG